MRTLTLATLVLLAAPAAPALAGDEEVIRLEVGATKPGVGTVRPMCDAPSVATISGGVVRALAVGETLCSVATVQALGLRKVYRIVVTPPVGKGPPAGQPDGGGGARAAGAN